ncbi:DUF6377 domain-containing protein [Pedobacter sp. GR22-6]|uniref:DUF6377 domain-containing protein n=1 Tax=Pedobacter sp. GR22-6 TaxID=3127957 RepID=UPI00307F5C19
MRIILTFLLSILLLEPAHSRQSSDSLLAVLKSEILKKAQYDQIKEAELKRLKQSLAAVPQKDISFRYTVLVKLIDAYKDYSFDSAHVYTNELVKLSNLLREPLKEYESKIRLGSLQLSWGMHKEAFDCIAQVNSRMLPDTTRLRFYEFKARAFHDLANYNTHRFYSPASRSTFIKTLDSVVLLSKAGSYERYKYTGQLYSITNQKKKAADVLKQLLNRKDLSIHQRAMVAHDLSYLVPDAEKDRLLLTAAIADIRTATKQTLAIFRLGNSFLDRGELGDAELLLTEAMAQAAFFGNEIQKKTIATTLTRLAAEKLIRSENEKIDTLVILISIVTLALIGIAIISYIVYKRLKKVKIREAAVREKYRHLDEMNKRLLEDAYIKEEYLGHFFHLISGYISILEKVKRNTEHRLKTENYEGLMQLTKEIDIKKERENLFYTFDTIFLKLFPNFIYAFNALLKPEDQIWPKNREILNTNLRIFALMRLGIKDTQTIANILETTVSTVYTYRNRIKSKAIVQGNAFDQEIMNIKFVDIS